MFRDPMVSRHQAILARAKEIGPMTVIAVCERAYRDFDKAGYPDNWTDWQQAQQDAMIQIRRKEKHR